MVTTDKVSPIMAGVGIRYLEFARALRDVVNVTILSPSAVGTAEHHVRFVHPDGDLEKAAELVLDQDVIILQAYASRQIVLNTLSELRPAIVIDLYCPFWLENGLSSVARADASPFQHRLDIETLRDQLRIGDFFLCASARQRDMLIGMLSVMGRVTSSQLERDPALTGLIGVVPFGLSSTRFSPSGPQVHALVPAWSATDRIIVWGGGIHDWLDVDTPLTAMELLRDRAPHIKLLFATAVSHPDHEVRPTAARALQVAQESGLLGSSVWFLDGWTPFDQRDRYLRGATAGLVCHLDHVETRFAFRTRVLDYLWAGLPIISSDGDEFADIIRMHDLGIVVPPGDPQALADAFVSIVARIDAGEAFSERIAAIRPNYHWDEVVKPLLQFCANPCKTAYHGDPVLLAGLPDVMTPRQEAYRLLHRTLTVIRGEGPAAVARKVVRTLRRLVRRVWAG